VGFEWLDNATTVVVKPTGVDGLFAPERFGGGNVLRTTHIINFCYAYFLHLRVQ
jgi:hypothetical protein